MKGQQQNLLKATGAIPKRKSSKQRVLEKMPGFELRQKARADHRRQVIEEREKAEAAAMAARLLQVDMFDGQMPGSLAEVEGLRAALVEKGMMPGTAGVIARLAAGETGGEGRDSQGTD